MTRIACLWIPLFPLAARLRSEPDLRDEALAVFQGSGNSARIAAATRRARRGGIRRGMTLAQARALLPRLSVRGRDAECERAAQESLIEIAESFSPRLEDAAEGVVYLDLEGLDRHFAGDSRRRTGTAERNSGPETELGRALAAASEKASLPARVGIASGKLAARLAARLPDSPTLVAPGAEAGFLAPLPIARLSPEAEVAETLRRWGIRSVGDLARLPRNQVAARLGPVGQKLHEKARGLDPQPLVPYRPPPAFHEGMELDWPLVSLEPFLFVARSALERLCRRLEARGLACARIDTALRLEPHGHHEISLGLPAPTRDAKTLLTLVRLDLEKRPPGAPVVGFTFAAHPDRPREAQLSLFGSTALSPDRLATTLARLFALLGPEGVGSPRPVDGHRPERCALVGYAPPPPAKIRPAPAPGRGLLAVRVLRPPVRLEVLTGPSGIDADAVAEGGSGRPPARLLEVRSLAGADRGRRLEIAGGVRIASGPWSLEEGWWSDAAVARDYWDVELTDGGIYRLFRDRVSGDWFADGVYD